MERLTEEELKQFKQAGREAALERRRDAWKCLG